MSKSELRKEYEARFGVVEGSLRLYDDKGNPIYNETSNGYWAKREFDAEGRRIYFENSKEGVVCDKRTCSDKVFIDEQSGKKFKLMEHKAHQDLDFRDRCSRILKDSKNILK